jgi:hypothetical protein
MNWRERRWYHVVIPSHTRKGEHTLFPLRWRG